jgi:D-amino-acid dehydrogenase
VDRFEEPIADTIAIGNHVRLAAEIGGLAREPAMRAEQPAASTVEAFASLARATCMKRMERRPCMPATLPTVGPVGAPPGLWLAFGHGHPGLTDAANTGMLLAEWITPEGSSAAAG